MYSIATVVTCIHVAVTLAMQQHDMKLQILSECHCKGPIHWFCLFLTIPFVLLTFYAMMLAILQVAEKLT